MPAKRSPKKSRKPSVRDVAPTDPDARTVAPLPTPSELVPTPSGPVPVPLPGTTPPVPPKPGPPPAGRDTRVTGRAQRAGKTRFYAFRRS